MTLLAGPELAAEGFPVCLTCGVLGFSTQAFYKWAADPICDRDLDDAHLTNAIVDIHADDPEFGYRSIADELEREGHQVSEGRVHRLCREHRIWSSTTKMGRRATKIPGPAVHDDLVQRDFSAPGPDLVWLTDIAEHRTSEGKLYACAIKDVFSNRIVGLCPLGSHDGGSGRAYPALGRGPAPASWHGRGPFGPRGPISFTNVSSRAQGQRAHWLHRSSLFRR